MVPFGQILFGLIIDQLPGVINKLPRALRLQMVSIVFLEPPFSLPIKLTLVPCDHPNSPLDSGALLSLDNTKHSLGKSLKNEGLLIKVADDHWGGIYLNNVKLQILVQNHINTEHLVNPWVLVQMILGC